MANFDYVFSYLAAVVAEEAAEDTLGRTCALLAVATGTELIVVEAAEEAGGGVAAGGVLAGEETPSMRTGITLSREAMSIAMLLLITEVYSK
uniref:Uncharacterized protein n=1 Tax=Romanomermis culicivorax TaxID=13658 RepID=A0A915KXU1_ROMCU